MVFSLRRCPLLSEFGLRAHGSCPWCLTLVVLPSNLRVVGLSATPLLISKSPRWVPNFLSESCCLFSNKGALFFPPSLLHRALLGCFPRHSCRTLRQKLFLVSLNLFSSQVFQVNWAPLFQARRKTRFFLKDISKFEAT